jgi:hypothetical protein
MYDKVNETQSKLYINALINFYGVKDIKKHRKNSAYKNTFLCKCMLWSGYKISMGF